MMINKCLVVGSGSIARRHISNLRTLLPEAEVGCVSASGRLLGQGETRATVLFDRLADAVDWSPQLSIVASPAPLHVEHAVALLNVGGVVLIEKPLSDCLLNTGAIQSPGGEYAARIGVAYNLRYLSSAKWMKDLIATSAVGRVYNVIINVGQYLPDWRPNSNYRQNVSAKRALGGGVLLELSHEFDYLNWMFGRFDSAYCISSTSGQLDIDVEDRADITLSRSDGLVAQLHMDFLQRKAARTCRVIGERGTLQWDINVNRIVMESADGEDVLFSEPAADRNGMYIELLRDFMEVAAGRARPRVTLSDGLEVLQMIEAMRQSSSSGRVVPIQGN